MAEIEQLRTQRALAYEKLKRANKQMSDHIAGGRHRQAHRCHTEAHEHFAAFEAHHVRYVLKAKGQMEDPEHQETFYQASDLLETCNTTWDTHEEQRERLEQINRSQAEKEQEAAETRERQENLFKRIEADLVALLSATNVHVEVLSSGEEVNCTALVHEVDALEQRFEAIRVFSDKKMEDLPGEMCEKILSKRSTVEIEFRKELWKLKSKAKDDGTVNFSVAAVSQPNSRGASPVRKDVLRHKKVEFPKFTGEVRDYNSFKSDFQDIVINSGHYDEAYMSHLLRHECLSGEAKRLVHNIRDYTALWARLDDHYDDRGEVIEQISQQVISLKKIDDDDYEGFVRFVDIIEKADLDMKAAEAGAVLSNPITVRSILSKCPKQVKEGLAKELQKLEPDKEFTVMLAYLSERRREATRLARLRGDRPARAPVKKGAAHVTERTKGQGPRPKCPVSNCVFQKPHFLSGCRAFQKMPVNDRGQVVLANGMCVICFTSGHERDDCPKKAAGWRTCDISGCGKWHHKLLHGATTPGLSLKVNVDPDPAENSALLLAQMVPAHHGEAAVLWDTGSTISLVRSEYAERAGLQGVDCQLDLAGVGENRTGYQTKMFLVPLINRSGQVVKINAFGIGSITTDMLPVDMRGAAKLFNVKMQELRRPAGPVDLLVGMNHANVLPVFVRASGRLVLFRSAFGTGHVVGGVTDEIQGGQKKVFTEQVCHAGGRAIRHVDFLTAEAFGVEIPKRCSYCRGCRECGFRAHQLTYTEAKELHEIEQGLALDTTVRKWEAKYPKIRDPGVLENNIAQAVACMHSLERRLRRTKQMEAFNEQFADAVDRGVFKLLEDVDEYQGPVNYVTLTEAFKEGEGVTTPLRLCMNSSMQYRGISLNDILVKGPSALNSIHAIMINFRAYPVALVKDVRKFYQSVSASVEDKHLRRVVWRYGSDDSPPQVFTTETVNFGDKPAGCVAMTAIRKTADLYSEVDPEAAHKLKEDIYVDDVASGADDRQAAERVSAKMEEIAAFGGFQFKSSTLSGDEVGPMKVLGTGWEPHPDELFLEVKLNVGAKRKGSKDLPDIDLTRVAELFPKELTKRVVWRVVLGQFDLLGLASVFFVRLKLLMRDLAGQEGQKYGWDEILPEVYRQKFVSLMSLLEEVRHLRFPRSLSFQDRDPAANPDLLVFGDGSMQAFCTTAYIRWKLMSGGYACRLIGGKTRVAPLKKISVPRLELLGAVAAVRLAATIETAVHFKFGRRFFFTDSTAVFGMIRGECGSFQEFVGTRTGEVKSKSDTEKEWFWLPSEENLADLGTREDVVPEMMGLRTTYQDGLPWMSLEFSQWPVSQNPGGQVPEEEIRGRGKAVLISQIPCQLISLEAASSFSKVVRILARVLMFIHSIFAGKEAVLPSLSSFFPRAENLLFSLAQVELQQSLNTGELTSLLPRRARVVAGIKEDQLIVTEGRSGGVMKIGYDKDFLPILPYSHHVSRILMWDAHTVEHCGVDRTLQRSRRIAWVVRGRRLAKVVVANCFECRRRRKQLEGQRIAPVHPSRLPPSPPFFSTAVDLFGPLEIRDTVKRRVRKKVWGVVFVCTVIGAVHLEVSEDYSTDSFIQCLIRFINLRGTPVRFQSDPGTQLVAASKQLNSWDFSRIRDWAHGVKSEWVLIPTDSQHFNGVAEAMVKATKRQLTACLENRTFTKGEMDTVLTSVATIINSRPLGKKAGEDVLTGGPITPLHLLTGRATIDVPEVRVQEDAGLVRRTKFIQETIDQFWTKWFTVVFDRLVPCHKWSTSKRNVKIGDIVLVKDANLVRGEYRLARVQKVHEGSDGRVRRAVVEYKLSGQSPFRTTERAIHNLCVIVPVDWSYEEV